MAKEHLDLYTFRPLDERLEFVSKIFVRYGPHQRVVRFPKPQKTLTNALVSFAKQVPLEEAGYTKYLTMAENCLACPVMFRYAIMMVKHFQRRGGNFNIDCLSVYDQSQFQICAPSVYANGCRISELEHLFVRHTLNETEGTDAVRKAFERETGMSVRQQCDHEVVFSACTDNAYGRAMGFLEAMGVLAPE